MRIMAGVQTCPLPISVYDGSTAAGRQADVAIRGDRIVAVGALDGMTAKSEIDARGMAVAPGFINMLSWSTESLLVDGRSQRDRKSTRLNSRHYCASRMPSSAYNTNTSLLPQHL